MFTPRGVAVCVAGIAMWFVARLIGSAGLEVVGIGFVLLPVVAGLFLRWTERRVSVRRRLSEVRVGPGTRLTAQLVPDARGPTPPDPRAFRSTGRRERARPPGATGLLLDPAAGAWALPDRS